MTSTKDAFTRTFEKLESKIPNAIIGFFALFLAGCFLGRCNSFQNQSNTDFGWGFMFFIAGAFQSLVPSVIRAVIGVLIWGFIYFMGQFLYLRFRKTK